jgi:ABC-type polysaccharide/polyol phosphate export permease
VNPLSQAVNALRQAVLSGSPLTFASLSQMIATSLLLMLIGAVVYR